MIFKNSAIAVVARALASILQPPEHIRPSEWAARNLVVPDGPRAGEPWSADLTPYVVEPLDTLGPDTGVSEIAVMKSAQTGFTTLLIAAIGHSIDRDPCRMGVLQPTDAALSDFNRDKLQVAIDGSKALRERVKPQLSRAGSGSTTYSKLFPGGSLALLLASSAADLRSKTIKKLFRDEIDQYPDDLDGQGDPLEISDGRLMSFLSSGEWKKADVSTPTIKGGSKIERRYEAGDCRRWHVKCPHCKSEDGSDSEFVFEPWSANFRFEHTYPHKAHYIAPCCGSIIQATEKNALVRKGRWLATNPGAGRYPSYHFDTASSPFVPWDEIAKAVIAAGDDPQKLKSLWNLWYGLPYEIKGDAPDHVRLMERRQPGLKRGHVPPRGLILTAAADVQMRGIWVEVVAFAPDRQSWVVDTHYLDGSTEGPDEEAFKKLENEVLNKSYPDAFGNMRTIDALAVDTGYRSHVVYAWVRGKQKMHAETGRDIILAVDGRPGWSLPAIGTPKLVDINLAGAKVKQGAKLWPVGTWSLKGGFYGDLNKRGVAAGAGHDPEGYCHFSDWLDEGYFRQITAEYLAEEKFKGRVRRLWKQRPTEKDNHLLDCRIYNLAVAEYLGLSSTTEVEWAELARRRGLPKDAIADGLFAPRREAAELEPTENSGTQEDVNTSDEKSDAFSRLAALNGE